MKPLHPRDPRQIGEYALVNRLGAGGMADVYLGERAREIFAVKIIRDSFIDDPTYIARFQREIATLRAISHPNVIRLVDSGSDDGRLWYATEFAGGQNLQQVVEQSGPLTEKEWWSLAVGLIGGLQAINQEGIIHRDVKPANIIMSPAGPKVIDLGIATGSDETSLTHTGLAPGTPAWFSPEHIDGQEVTAASDFFSAASVLVFAATGNTPWGPLSSVSHRNVAQKIFEPPELSGLSQTQKGVVSNLLDLDPEVRIKHAEKLAGIFSRGQNQSGIDWSMPDPTSSALDRISPTPDRGPRVGAISKVGEKIAPYRRPLVVASAIAAATGIALWLAPLQQMVEDYAAQAIVNSVTNAYADGDVATLRNLFLPDGEQVLPDQIYSQAIRGLGTPTPGKIDRTGLQPGVEPALWATAEISFPNAEESLTVDLELTSWKRFLWLHIPVFADTMKPPHLTVSLDVRAGDLLEIRPVLEGQEVPFGTYSLIPGVYTVTNPGGGIVAPTVANVTALSGEHEVLLTPQLAVSETGSYKIQSLLDEKIASCNMVGDGGSPNCFGELLAEDERLSISGSPPEDYFSSSDGDLEFAAVECEPGRTLFTSATEAAVTRECVWSFRQERVFFGSEQGERFRTGIYTKRYYNKDNTFFELDFDLDEICPARPDAPVCQENKVSTTIRGEELFRGVFEFTVSRTVKVSVSVDGNQQETVSDAVLVASAGAS